MREDVQKLRDQRANLWEQAKALLDAGLNSAEDVQRYERMEADLDALDNRIEAMERAAERADRYSQAVTPPAAVLGGGTAIEDGDDDHLNKVFAQFIRRGINSLGAEDRALMESRFDTSIQNAAGVGTGAAGGYTVPPAFRDKFVEVRKAFGPMLQEAEVIETDTGANLPWPTNDDTGNMGAILAENTQVTEQDVTFGTASLDAYMYTSKLVRASLQFLQDSPNGDTWLARKLGERVGRILNNHFTVGTGTSQPDGIVTSATVGVTGTGSFATTGGVTGDQLIDLYTFNRIEQAFLRIGWVCVTIFQRVLCFCPSDHFCTSNPLQSGQPARVIEMLMRIQQIAHIFGVETKIADILGDFRRSFGNRTIDKKMAVGRSDKQRHNPARSHHVDIAIDVGRRRRVTPAVTAFASLGNRFELGSCRCLRAVVRSAAGQGCSNQGQNSNRFSEHSWLHLCRVPRPSSKAEPPARKNERALPLLQA